MSAEPNEILNRAPDQLRKRRAANRILNLTAYGLDHVTW
jgi:hypothetical protein